MVIMKRAQGSVAVLIALIALFIVAYVLFLPPGEREKLLNQTTNGDTLDGRTLLLESPGLVSPSEKGKLEHNINDVNLFVKTEPVVVDLAKSLSISKSLFGSNSQELSFNVEDLTDLDRAILSFTVSNPKGELIVELNGQKVFQQKIRTSSVEVISLPVDLLRKVNNLRMYASSPGIAFWAENHYTLNEVKIIEYFERENSQEERTFVMSNNEFENAQSVSLDYSIFCNSLEGAAVFKVYLNDKLILPQTLNCITSSPSLDLDLDDLKEGQNTLRFVIDRGDFLISNMKVITKTTGAAIWSRTFSINSDDFDMVTSGEFRVILKLSLETKGTKQAKIEINEDSFTLDTTSDTFSKDISDFVEKGENIIRIIPDEDFSINTLRISLQER